MELLVAVAVEAVVAVLVVVAVVVVVIKTENKMTTKKYYAQQWWQLHNVVFFVVVLHNLKATFGQTRKLWTKSKIGALKSCLNSNKFLTTN